jgi:hypothetical protein
MDIFVERGGLSFLFEPETGFVRYIKFGGRELVRAIYAAVRNEHWGTLAPELVSLQEGDGYIRWTHHCRQGGETWLVFDGEITWDETSVKYEVDGQAQRDYMTARTGLCLLHPRDQQGMPLTVIHADGSEVASQFPEQIAPETPFTEVSGFRFADGDREVSIKFSGEVFETEDQRNWMDASFKTYCWPQGRGWPYPVSVFEPIRHSAEVKVSGDPIPVELSDPLSINWSDAPEYELPQIGTVIRGAAPEITQYVDTGMMIADGDDVRFSRDLEAAEQSGLPITLFLRQPWTPALQALTAGEPLITRIHIDLRFADQLAAVQADCPDLAILLASGDNFTDLNRFSGDRSHFAGVAFSGNPQVHAFDTRSIGETASTIVDQIRSADHLTDGLVVVGPLWLAAPGSAPRPSSPDYESELFAAWMLGTIISATQAGAYSIVIAETTGERGLFQSGELTLAGDLLRQMAEHEGPVKIPASPAPHLWMVIQLGSQQITVHFGDAPRVVIATTEPSISGDPA